MERSLWKRFLLLLLVESDSWIATEDARSEPQSITMWFVPPDSQSDTVQLR